MTVCVVAVSQQDLSNLVGRLQDLYRDLLVTANANFQRELVGLLGVLLVLNELEWAGIPNRNVGTIETDYDIELLNRMPNGRLEVKSCIREKSTGAYTWGESYPNKSNFIVRVAICEIMRQTLPTEMLIPPRMRTSFPVEFFIFSHRKDFMKSNGHSITLYPLGLDEEFRMKQVALGKKPRKLTKEQKSRRRKYNIARNRWGIL